MIHHFSLNALFLFTHLYASPNQSTKAMRRTGVINSKAEMVLKAKRDWKVENASINTVKDLERINIRLTYLLLITLI